MQSDFIAREVIGLMALGVFVWLVLGLIAGGFIELVSGYRAYGQHMASRAVRRKRRRIARKRAVIVEQSARRLATAIGKKWNVAEGSPLFGRLVEVCGVVLTDCERRCGEVKK